MTPRKPLRKVLRALCAEAGPDDGIDPRDSARSGRSGSRPGPSRKARQLGRQVAETLDAVLAGERDDVLRNLRVVDVAPAPYPGRLLVTVTAHPPTEPAPDPAAGAHDMVCMTKGVVCLMRSQVCGSRTS